MRISDDRYNRDIRRHTLAMRLIHHQARTDTIQRWTGLSPFRIRALVHSYTEETGSSSVRRHRGAAPRKLSVFYKSPDHEIQSLALAICYQLEGLIPKDPVRGAADAFPELKRASGSAMHSTLSRECSRGPIWPSSTRRCWQSRWRPQMSSHLASVPTAAALSLRIAEPWGSGSVSSVGSTPVKLRSATRSPDAGRRTIQFRVRDGAAA